MIYKNARIYTYPAKRGDIFGHEELEALAFQEIGPMQAESAGFVPPFPGSDQLTHHAENTTLICLQIQQRILPSSVINKATAARVATIEEAQQRKVYRKERLTIKEEALAELLPRAFTKEKRILAHIDHTAGLVIIDTTSSLIAETLLTRLREALGSFPVLLPEAGNHPGAVLTNITRPHLWPNHEFSPGTKCKLRQVGESATATFREEDITGEEVQAHIDAGMQPEEVEVIYHEVGRFTLTDTLILKGIKLDAQLIHDTSGELEDSAKHDADYCLNVRSLRQIYKEMARIFAIDTEHAAPAAQPAASAA